MHRTGLGNRGMIKQNSCVFRLCSFREILKTLIPPIIYSRSGCYQGLSYKLTNTPVHHEPGCFFEMQTSGYFRKVCYTIKKAKDNPWKEGAVMIRIALCDDEPAILDEVSSCIYKYAEKKNTQNIEIVRFDSARALKSAMDDGRNFDIYVLDVYIGDEVGTTLARDIRKRESKTPSCS